MLLLIAAAHAECAFHATTADLDRALSAAEVAYLDIDELGFERATTELDFVVPCLVEPVSPSLAARFHRVRALGRFADGDRDGARDALVGARAIEPDYAFPVEVLPVGFELRTLYEGLAPPVGEPEVHLPRPSAGGSLWLDGAGTRDRPVERGVLYQRLDRDGAAVESVYLTPDQATPRYPGVNQRRTALLVTGGLTGAAAATVYALAWSSREQLSTPLPTWNEADLVDVQRHTNTLGATSVGLAGLAVGQAILALTWTPR